MGGDQSQPAPYRCDDEYLPVGEQRMNHERYPRHPSETILSIPEERRNDMIRPPFNGIWSIRYPNSIPPPSRCGHFYCYDKDNHRAFMGYGMDTQDTLLNDLWILDTLKDTWTRLPLLGPQLSPRTGSRAVYFMGKIFVFGGYSDPNYFADLHMIDVSTGHIKLIHATGEGPTPRTQCIFFEQDHKLFVWGGFNGDWPSDLHVLDLDTMHWTTYPQEVAGRVTSPGVIYKNKYYAYGGRKAGGMLVIELDTHRIYIEQTKGVDPPSGATGPGMILVEKYMFFFGGKVKSNTNWSLVYACDLEKLLWFVFHIAPDGSTVSREDGSVDELGLFMVPRIHSFGVVYVPEKREIVAFMGSQGDPPPLFVLRIGKAMGVIHLREDLCEMLSRG